MAAVGRSARSSVGCTRNHDDQFDHVLVYERSDTLLAPAGTRLRTRANGRPRAVCVGRQPAGG